MEREGGGGGKVVGRWCGREAGDSAVAAPWQRLLVGIQDVDYEERERHAKNSKEKEGKQLGVMSATGADDD